MDEFGQITIDNKHLLNDLLELNNDNSYNDLTSTLKHSNKVALNQPNDEQPVDDDMIRQVQYIPNPSLMALNGGGGGGGGGGLSAAYGSSILQGKKVYLESPTFAKEEDEIYRYWRIIYTLQMK